MAGWAAWMARLSAWAGGWVCSMEPGGGFRRSSGPQALCATCSRMSVHAARLLVWQYSSKRTKSCFHRSACNAHMQV
eukprot:scaffold238430_cov20-Tisochrysis_lutea.AAC.2